LLHPASTEYIPYKHPQLTFIQCPELDKRAETEQLFLHLPKMPSAIRNRLYRIPFKQNLCRDTGEQPMTRQPRSFHELDKFVFLKLMNQRVGVYFRWEFQRLAAPPKTSEAVSAAVRNGNPSIRRFIGRLDIPAPARQVRRKYAGKKMPQIVVCGLVRSDLHLAMQELRPFRIRGTVVTTGLGISVPFRDCSEAGNDGLEIGVDGRDASRRTDNLLVMLQRPSITTLPDFEPHQLDNKSFDRRGPCEERIEFHG
jgi:hypothetical protein